MGSESDRIELTAANQMEIALDSKYCHGSSRSRRTRKKRFFFFDFSYFSGLLKLRRTKKRIRVLKDSNEWEVKSVRICKYLKGWSISFRLMLKSEQEKKKKRKVEKHWTVSAHIKFRIFYTLWSEIICRYTSNQREESSSLFSISNKLL